jgi:hypothetical protein
MWHNANAIQNKENKRSPSPDMGLSICHSSEYTQYKYVCVCVCVCTCIYIKPIWLRSKITHRCEYKNSVQIGAKCKICMARMLSYLKNYIFVKIN